MSTCPDNDLLSAYIDDELLSPWKEMIEQHLQECSTCKEIYNRYTLVQRCMRVASAGYQFDSGKSFAKLREKREALLKKKQQTKNKRLHTVLEDCGFFSSICVPVPAAAAALLLFVLMPVFLFLKAEPPTPPVAVSRSSFIPIVPVSPEKQKLVAERDYGISQVNTEYSHTVSTKAVSANDKLFMVGAFTRLYSKNEDMFAPAQSTVSLKISSSPFPFVAGYQLLSSTTNTSSEINTQ